MTNKTRLTIVAVVLVVVFCATFFIVLKGQYLRPRSRQLPAPDLSLTVSHDSSWPGENRLTSQANVASDGLVIAGRYAAIIVTYTAGRGGLNTFGGIRAAFEHGADWGKLQTVDPQKDNYVTVFGPKGVKFRLISDNRLGYCEMVEAQLVQGKIGEGQSIMLTIGDRSGGSNGLMAPTISAVRGAGRIRVFEDRTGAGHFYSIPDIPDLHVLPNKPHHLKVITRSWGIVGKPIVAFIQINDQYNNIAASYNKDLKITDLENGNLISEKRITYENNGILRMEEMTCAKEGIFRFKVQEAEGDLSAISNPIKCVADADAPKVFFGSIHSHTLLSDGLNTIEGATQYARDISHLDFFATTDHAILPDDKYDHVLLRHNINENQWKQTASVMRQYNNPGSFVTFLAFEWSTKKYGDKNIYFFDDNAPYRKFPATPEELYKSIGGERVAVVTHTMMGITGQRGPNWDFVDTRFEKVMEIASGHGIREYAGNYYPICENDKNLDASLMKGNLAAEVIGRGLRLGFVAGSDDHSGKPGAGAKGILACPINGLTAVWASSLSRETIFDGIQNRRAYATTGAKILLSFSINGHDMGEEFEIKRNKSRKIIIEAHGESPISEVDIIRENPAEPVKVWKWDTPVFDPGTLEWTDDSPLAASTWYYVRVIQSDNQMAWSSPIWVDLETGK